MTPTLEQTAFDTAYWLSMPPAVRGIWNVALDDGGQGGETASSRYKAAIALAQQGFTIDVPIMIWGWDPLKVMQMRQALGLQSTPDAFGNKQIKVSTTPSDYPPFDPPPPPANMQPPIVLVGPQSVGNIYYTVAGDHSPDGTKYTDQRGTFVKHVFAVLAGYQSYWTLES